MPKRTDLHVPEFYQNYLSKAGDDDLGEALKKNTKRLRKLLDSIPAKKWDYAYAEGKWSLRQLIQHMIDTERVFAFRALWFSRNDPQALPGFDENQWAEQATASQRKPSELIEEFHTLRKSTEHFFRSLPEEVLLRSGLSSTNRLGVAALGFLCAGHVNHHIDIIEERYLKGKKEKGKGKEKEKVKVKEKQKGKQKENGKAKEAPKKVKTVKKVKKPDQGK